jgi:hypothetical protein
MRSSTCSGGRLPENLDPEPRPARRWLRAQRPAERRRAGGGIAIALRRRRQAPHRWIAGRLADRGLAAAAAALCAPTSRANRAAPRSPRAQPAVEPVALEDPGQPPAQSCAGRA